MAEICWKSFIMILTIHVKVKIGAGFSIVNNYLQTNLLNNIENIQGI